MNKLSLTYKDVGVNTDLSNMLIGQIKNIAKKTYRPEIIGELGGFSALCSLPVKYQEPILVATTDGVGSKPHLITDIRCHNIIGIDLVAMCVNDLIVQGAEPLFLLDYYATSKLDIEIITNLINGITDACLQSGCALIGGETAEMPGIYHNKDYDIAGFCIGIVEKSKIIDGSKIKEGDILVALNSSGLHSNGYSVVRKILELNNLNLQTVYLKSKSLADHLLVPTRIYVKIILELISKFEIHGIIHLTGGGFWENIPRILPNNTQAVIYESTWQWPVIFNWIQQKGNISRHEMYHIFNCGVGMIIIIPPSQAEKVIRELKTKGENAWKIGVIRTTSSNKSTIIV